MWVVRSAFANFDGSAPFRKLCCVISVEAFQFANFDITIQDTDTGVTLKLLFMSEQDILTAMAMYAPYGLCAGDRNNTDGNSNQYYAFEIDDISLKFLEYVESVDELVIDDSHQAYHYMLTTDECFFPIDQYRTLMINRALIPREGAGGLTLFYIACSRWGRALIDGHLYLCYSAIYPRDTNQFKVFCVKFTDLQAVNRLITKARITSLDKRQDYTSIDLF